MLKMLDFECQDCGHSFEELVKDEEYPECEECGGGVLPLPAGTRTNFRFADRLAHKR